MSVFISVLIPLYNKENYIRKTLESVLNQSFTDFEIIVLNDGSTDNSLDIVNATLESFPNKTIHTQENKGLSATRNKGISIAKGKVVALLDADDFWDNHFLQTIYNLYNSFPEAHFYGTDYIEEYTKNIQLETRKNLSEKLKNTSFLVDDFFKVNLHQNILCQSSLAFRKEIFETIKYDETINFSEDIDFYLKSFVRYKLAYAYKPLAIILSEVPNQITKSGINDKTITNLDAYETLAAKNPSLKQFLDFYRYSFGSQYKQAGNFKKFKEITRNIDQNNLNFNQRMLLKSPRFLLNFLIGVKKMLLRKKIRVSTY